MENELPKRCPPRGCGCRKAPGKEQLLPLSLAGQTEEVQRLGVGTHTTPSTAGNSYPPRLSWGSTYHLAAFPNIYSIEYIEKALIGRWEEAS